ncbi:MAG: nitrogen fixation protein [Phyllobacteriaceae bacterium]|nr:nitrogen fixation protein [Phyllobacteriaceae bacterium]
MADPETTVARSCPSAQPGMSDAVVLGVVETGADGRQRVAYVEAPVPLTPELAAIAAPASAGKVLRLAAKCAGGQCAHFDGHDCSLVKRVASMLPEAARKAPPCFLRRTCRWFTQEGVDACFRCEMIVTEFKPNPRLNAVAAPPEV